MNEPENVPRSGVELRTKAVLDRLIDCRSSREMGAFLDGELLIDRMNSFLTTRAEDGPAIGLNPHGAVRTCNLVERSEYLSV